MKKWTFAIGLIFGLISMAFSQVTLPPSGDNQKSFVGQFIGPLAYVKIVYNSPDVTSPTGEDRTGKIWGQLVPYGFTQQGFGLNNPSPWRAGANEATIIYFSHDVLFEGQPVPAGKYAFFVAPAEEGPWTIVLNKNYDAWGSFFYEEEDDVVRVKVEPKETEFHEWLTFEFDDRQPDYAVGALKWENVAVPFKIEVPDDEELIVANLRSELQGQQGFTWTNWNAAANYCLNKEVNLEEAMTWAQTAVKNPFFGSENFNTLQTLAGIQDKLGKTEEAEATMTAALSHPTANIFQIHQYGRQLIAQGDEERAMKVFKHNMDRFGDVWPVRVGMARGLSALGKYDEALEHAKVALDRAPDDLNKNNLTKMIEKLKNHQDVN